MSKIAAQAVSLSPPGAFERWLIADIDGTFIGGAAAERSQLNGLFTSRQRRIGLVYCSGRALHDVLPDIDAGLLAAPDAIIGDVGTGLWDACGRELCAATHAEIEARWADGTARVLEALADIDGLVAQHGTGPRRCSFFYETVAAARVAAERVAPLGYDTLISGGRYFDVLPRGVNKGFAVARLMQLWSLPADAVLTAGDTLNDLSMLLLPVHSVAVANADPELVERLDGAPRTRLASRAGAGGILEAMRALGWID